MIRSFAVVALMYMTSGETATAFDLKTLEDLMPWKYAAISMANGPNKQALRLCGSVGRPWQPHHRKKSASGVWPSSKRYGAALPN